MNMKKLITATRRSILGATLALATLAAGWAGTAKGAIITWNPTTGGNWNTSTANWTGDSTTFTDNNTVNVIFDKTGGGTITISADMSPLSTTVSAASGTYIFSGGPIDSGTLTKSGAGILTLAGANSFSGVTLSVGQLNINNAGALGTGTFTISGGGKDVVKIDNTSGSPITLSTNNPLALSGSITFYRSSGLNLGTGAVTLGAGLTIYGNGATSVPLTIGGNIASTSNGLILIRGATVILTGTNNYTGQTKLANDGGGVNVLRANDGAGLPTDSNLLIQVGVFETGIDLVRAGGTGAGQMQLDDAGTTPGTVNGFSANGGPVNIAFGTLASPTALTWSTTGNFQPHAQGGLLLNHSTANNTLNFRNAVNLGSAVRTVTVKATDAAAIATMSGLLSGGTGGGLLKAGAGTLVLSGANTYPGVTRVSAGTLKAGIASVAGLSGAFGLDSAVTNDNVAGVTLDLNGFDTAIGSLAGGGALGGNVTLGTNTLTTGANNTSTTFAGVISGSNTCGIVKTGTGTMTLSGVNTYTGDTTVSDGTLKLSVANTLDDNSSVKIVTASGKAPKVALAAGIETINALYIDGK